jgi:hypothetical protein
VVGLKLAPTLVMELFQPKPVTLKPVPVRSVVGEPVAAEHVERVVLSHVQIPVPLVEQSHNPVLTHLVVVLMELGVPVQPVVVQVLNT